MEQWILERARWLGGIAALAKQVGGIEVHGYYPHLLRYEHEIPYSQGKALQLGAVIHPMRGGRIPVLYSYAKKDIENMGGYMIPMGLVLPESVIAVERETHNVPDEALGGCIVILVGSGMMTAGVSKGLSKKVKKIYGISDGLNTTKQRNKIMRVLDNEFPDNIILIKPEWANYFSKEEIETPFPSSPFYDKKAWRWMLENLNNLEDPILFWNIGT